MDGLSIQWENEIMKESIDKWMIKWKNGYMGEINECIINKMRKWNNEWK